MDAITLLKEDHHTVAQLFTRFERAGDEAYETKRQIVDRIIHELSVHAAIEEQAFYPAVRREVKGTEDMTLESLEEHHIVKWLLSELEGMDPHAERFDAKVTVLIENVRHHVEEEEGDLFPKVRDQMSRTRLDELGDRLAALKKTVPSRPHPRSPDTPPANFIAGAAAGLMDKATDVVKSAVSDTISKVTGSGDEVAEHVIDAASNAKDSAEKRVRKATTTAKRTTKQTTRKATATAKPATKRVRAATPAKRSAKPTASSAKRSTKRAATTAKRTAKKAPATAKKSATATKRTTRKATTSAKKAPTAAKRTVKRTAKRATASR